jgi:hypothetical protein
LNLKRIKCKTRIGVDPNPLVTKVKGAEIIKTTSDNFFITNTRTFDIIFIDGLHTNEQSYRDFINACKILNTGGKIILHDCNPTSRELAISFNEGGKWNGDVYKTIMKINASGEYSVQTVDIDNGCGVIELEPSGRKIDYIPDYDWFDKNRITAINLISWEDYINPNYSLEKLL